MDQINYANLREVQKKEMENSALAILPEDFYQRVKELLQKKSAEAINSKSILTIKEYENIKKIVITIQIKREEKLALIALRGDKEVNGITKEEKDFVERFSGIIDDMRNEIHDRWEWQENKGNIKKDKRVKILKDVEQYKGIDSNIYGPFRLGDEIDLPEEEANWLLKAKMAQNV